MKRVILTLSVLLFAATAAFAQQDPPPRGNQPAPGLTPMDVADMLDAYALMQAETTLQLRDAQFADFVTRLKALQQTRRRNLQRRIQLLRELQKAAGPQAVEFDENAAREKLRLLREHDERAAAELRKAYEMVDEVLDVRQQARFRVFEDVIERRKLDLLMRARAGAARGRGTTER